MEGNQVKKWWCCKDRNTAIGLIVASVLISVLVASIAILIAKLCSRNDDYDFDDFAFDDDDIIEADLDGETGEFFADETDFEK